MDILFTVSFMLMLTAAIGLIVLYVQSTERVKALSREKMDIMIQLIKNNKEVERIAPEVKHVLQPKEDILSLNLSRNELYKALNYLMMYGVITYEEYNQIETKALSYVKA